MNNGVFSVLLFFFWVLPYPLISWGYTRFTDGDWKTFWTCFAVVVGVRIFFALIEGLGNLLSWALFRKQFVVQKIVQDFKRFNFPKREDQDEDWLSYLTRIQENESLPFPLR